MNEIVTELSKPIWWFSVVVAGMAINLLSAYLKDSLDKVLASVSSWWWRYSDTQKKAWLEQVSQLRSDAEARGWAVSSEIRYRLQAIHLLLFAIFSLVLPVFFAGYGKPLSQTLVILAHATSAFSFFGAFLAHQMALKTVRALKQAQKL